MASRRFASDSLRITHVGEYSSPATQGFTISKAGEKRSEELAEAGQRDRRLFGATPGRISKHPSRNFEQRSSPRS